jgi:hypothetical protein
VITQEYSEETIGESIMRAAVGDWDKGELDDLTIHDHFENLRHNSARLNAEIDALLNSPEIKPRKPKAPKPEPVIEAVIPATVLEPLAEQATRKVSFWGKLFGRKG